MIESGLQKKLKILLLGPNGQLGESLKNHLEAFHELECADKKKFDFLNPTNFLDILKKSKPQKKRKKNLSQQGLNPGLLGYKLSALTTTPQ